MQRFILHYLLFTLLLVSCTINSNHLKTGDLIYQNLDCGNLCDAIEEVTRGSEGYQFSHIGFVSLEGEETYVYESIGDAVVKTQIDSFLARTSNRHYVSRLKYKYKKQNSKALEFIQKQLGVAYDDEFLYDNGKYYCSELIFDAYKNSTEDSSMRPFKLLPMEFTSLDKPKIDRIWIEYYQNLGLKVPEGKPGANPASIARSRANRWLKKLN